MAARTVGKITKSVVFGASLLQNVRVLPRLNCLTTELRPAATVLVQAISTNAGVKQNLWSCSKGVRGEVTIQCLKDMLTDGKVQLFDVRQPHEIAELGRIPKSVNIPLNEIHTAFNLNSAEFQGKYGVPKPDVEDDNIIFHCQSGKRARKAVEKVQELGFAKASNFVGGWNEWQFDLQHQPKAVPRKICMEH